MGASVLVLGHSGSGKSTSLRNFEPGEVGIFNVAGKPLPFRKKLDKIDHSAYGQIDNSLSTNKLRAYVIDDANYLMAFQNFAMAKQSGYGKFTDMAVSFERLLEAANRTDSDTIVYFMMHPDYDESGRMKPKSIGKMLDNQLTIEGMFPIVLLADNDESGYHFVTASDGTTPVKAPMGMFPDAVIDNDLKAVDAAIREYWGMAPLNGGDEK
ncbi:hypothetical protein FIC87_12485 [Eggerthella lenta]|uniref:ATP-binding protein n=1 Tax=Eggerthella lenta TaxID=84112 RepID=A0A5C5BRE0_EGGLN|nr:hypothetical protein [Eggerthella lenta]TNU89010.1 hypothetical protein FIC87_12485 [Eggerthella lenta]